MLEDETPPANPDHRPRFVHLAKFAWLSLCVSVVVNLSFQAIDKSFPNQPELRWVRFAITATLAALGILAGIAALFGVRRHGRANILWPALVGIALWGGTFAISYSVLNRLRESRVRNAPAPSTTLRPLILLRDATRFQDPKLGIAFDLPPGFEPAPRESLPPACTHGFIKQAPGEPTFLILVQPLGGIIPRQRLTMKDLPAGTPHTLAAFDWRGLDVDAIRVPESNATVEFVTYNVQLPLRKQAVQIAFGGPAESEQAVLSLARTLLAGFEGDTNW